MTKTKPRVRKFQIYYFFSTLFFGLAGLLISWDRSFAKFAVISLLIFFVLAAFGLRLQLVNHGSGHKKATRWLWVVIVFGIILCGALLSWDGRKVAKPHLRLVLNTSITPTVDLQFTNEFLFTQTSDVTKAGGLLIPVPREHTNVVLRFGFVNDTATQNQIVDDAALTVDVAFLELLLLGKAKYGAHPNWQRRATPDKNVDLLMYSSHMPLIPGRGEATPIITVTTTNLSEPMASKPLFAFVSLRGKNVPRITLMFNIVFLWSDQVVAPSISPPIPNIWDDRVVERLWK